MHQAAGKVKCACDQQCDWCICSWVASGFHNLLLRLVNHSEVQYPTGIKRIKGNPKVLTVHGDNESCVNFAKEIHEKFGLEAFSPEVDEVITV